MRREYSISPTDVDYAATNIAVVREGQRSAMVDAIVLYDFTHGSLRLSELAYTQLDILIERLKAAVTMTSEHNELLLSDIVDSLSAWVLKLTPESDDMSELLKTVAPGAGRPGWMQVYARGSIVCRRNVQGIFTDIEIVGPELATFDEGPLKLFYRYRSSAGVMAMTPADLIEAVGDQWSYTYWNPETNEYADELEDLAPRSVDRPVTLSDSIMGSWSAKRS